MATINREMLSTTSQKPNIVYGTVLGPKNKPLSNLVVRVYDKNMRTYEFLGEATTDNKGYYKVTWFHGQLKGKNRKGADLAIKIFSTEKKAELYRLPMDEVRFNASPMEEINVAFAHGMARETIEFDFLVNEISYLSERVPIIDLQESKEHQDITFLSKELEVPTDKIEHLVVAYRLSKSTKVEPGFFYTLFRMGTLLGNRFISDAKARSHVDMASDETLILYDIALTEEKKIREGVKKACNELLVSQTVLRNIKKSLAGISYYHPKAQAYYKNEHPEKIIALLSSVFKKGNLDEARQLFKKNRGDLVQFFEQVSNDLFSEVQLKKTTAKTTSQFDDLTRAGSSLIPGLIQEKRVSVPTDIGKLATLNKTDWEEKLAKSAGSEGAKLNSTYASAIVRKLEREFPTMAFMAQLEREEKSVLNHQKEIVDFLKKHEDFELHRDNVDVFMKQKKIKATERDAIGEELKAIQRVFKLTPSYSKTLALREQKIHSAMNIVQMGKENFVNEIAPRAGMNPKEAIQVFLKAETRHTAAMLAVGELRDSLSVIDIASFETENLSKKLDAVSADFPNLKSLFKTVDACKCEHCRSVYGPAAYLVEILQFLEKRKFVEGSAKSVLFKRRPDLGEIDLNCSNANTPVKYIDLVCELLEDAVSPESGINFTGNLSEGINPLSGKVSKTLRNTLQAAGIPVSDDASIHETEPGMFSSDLLPHYLRDKDLVCKIEHVHDNDYKVYRLRQTFAPAEELQAAPEYINQNAYDVLKQRSFAFNLPFDLNHTEARAYFDRFDVSRAALMKAFQTTNTITDEEIAAESLGLTEAERLIIAKAPSPNDNSAQQKYWNVPAPGKVLDYLKRVDNFLDRTQIAYKELESLLQLKFIDPNGKLSIKHNNTTCDTAEKEIKNLTLSSVDRIHRFLRLQKKTSLDFWVLNAIIMQKNLGNGKLNNACLVKISQLQEISNKTGIKIEELAGCFGEIPCDVATPHESQPLYHQIFLNKAKNGDIDKNLLPERIGGAQQIGFCSQSIATSLQLNVTDLEEITATLPNDKLTFANLSALLLAARLIKKMGINAKDLSVLVDLVGKEINGSPKSMLNFVQVIEDCNKSTLLPTEIKYLICHESDDFEARLISEKKIEELLSKLSDSHDTIQTQLKSKYDEFLTTQEQSGTLLEVLAGLKGMNNESAKTILGFLNKEWVSVAEAKSFIDKNLDQNIDRTHIHVAIDNLNSIAKGLDISQQQKALVKAFFDAISEHQILEAKKVALEQLLTASFKVDSGIIKVILAHAQLKQVAPGTDSLLTLLLDDFQQETKVANYPKASDCLRLLHKMLFAINALKLTSEEIEWYFINNPGFGWFQMDGIPFDVGQDSLDLSSYLDFTSIVSLNRELLPVVDPKDAEKAITFFGTLEMLLPSSNPSKSDFVQRLSLLTSHSEETLNDIEAYLFEQFEKENYHGVGTWRKMLNCAEFSRTLSASINQIIEIAKPVLQPSDVSDLRALLKSRYDETTWLNTQKEIMDKIRPQKRDALVTYLLAANPNIKSENDLYDYFLVDVQMEACMPSSRIVFAHNSIQLFIQRSLMGVEPEAIADMENDPNWDQWKWMKNYRVWEANRKVFLYPENWYDVSLSDNRSYMLDEFMDELRQNELTSDGAEVALKNYLEKLDNLAFLEVTATWYDTKTKEMHVFARTKGGNPAQYYYRMFEKERYWTPWEKVELDITGDILLVFKRNDRLHLAWPLITYETDPNPKSTVPNGDEGIVENDKPKKKQKIQLAISVLSHKGWEPKKLSRTSMLTPGTFTSEDTFIDVKRYNLIYSEPTDQIVLASNLAYWNDMDNLYVNGIFSLTGCKGYPELVYQGSKLFSNFYPDFKNAEYLSQRYHKLADTETNELTIRTGRSAPYYYKILNRTSESYRITYPHQLTSMDLLSMLYKKFISILSAGDGKNNGLNMNVALGTMLPYFKEDGEHAYVIIPGYYKEKVPRRTTSRYEGMAGYAFNDQERRTVSDTLQLWEDIESWMKRTSKDFDDNPPKDAQAGMDRVVKDPDFHDILAELSKYESLDFIFNMLIGKTGSEDFDALLTELRNSKGLMYGEQLKNMYHPLACKLRSVVYKDGVRGLMKRSTQLQQTPFNFEKQFEPNVKVVPKTMMKQADGTILPEFPVEDLDFTSDGSYSLYNWDLFYRLPLHIAESLKNNQRFEEALTWFHYMFDPTGALPGTGVQKYWVTKPFYLNQDTDYLAQRIDNLMYAVADASNPDIRELEFAIDEWREKPFRPDAVARFRPVAYQKALLMKYIDNLIAWGDHLFRQDTMESIAQATQMYVLADKLLGPKPRVVPSPKMPTVQTYNQMEAKLDSFGNALVEFENILPELKVVNRGSSVMPTPPITLSTLYFCIPGNEKMKQYWDRVADRLFKIRHCQNIDGVERSLALFAPPIDPGLLTKAFASGLDISSIMAGLNAPTPHYRFNILSQQATELAQEVRFLGNSLLNALEKKDAEELALLRNKMELKVMDSILEVKKKQIEQVEEQVAVLELSKEALEERKQFYETVDKISNYEQEALDYFGKAASTGIAASTNYFLGATVSLIPDISIGVSGFGGSPHNAYRFGGSLIAKSTEAVGKALEMFSNLYELYAKSFTSMGMYERRYDEWKMQERVTVRQLDAVDQQIKVAEIQKQIAEADLKTHEIQIENEKKMGDFMKSKFTNKELYDWMVGQIGSVYYKSYQMAHDLAKKAEMCYRFELGNDDSYISYGYWDNMKKGLQCADSLIHDIKNMETNYVNKNKREYEITKHISLARLDPFALIRLRETGVCDFDIPEAIFDMDFAGQYFRRLKAVRISIPCIAGPYTSVNAKMSMITNKYRKEVAPDNQAGTGYAEDAGNDERFVYNVGAIQSIATSTAQNDGGVFELNFRDERYLPFENKGVISSWRLELPEEVRQFDYGTISDIIVHMSYTSREGGSGLKTAVNNALNEQLANIQQDLDKNGLHMAINMKHELPNEWHLLKKNGTIDLKIGKERFPYMVQPLDASIENVMFLAKVAQNPANFEITLNNGNPTNLARIDDLNLCGATANVIEMDTPFNLSVSNTDIEKLEELIMVIKYSF